jgi:predicted DNA-binding protein
MTSSQRQQVRKLAVRLGKTDSELVRELIEGGLVAESNGRRLALPISIGNLR